MDKLDHLGWVVSRSFAIGGVRFAVRSTAPAFGGWLSDVLGAYEVKDVEDFLFSVVAPEPQVIKNSKEFFILYQGSSAIVRTLDPATLGAGLLAQLEGLQLHERDDAAFVTASLVEVPGGSVLVPQPIGTRLAGVGRRAERLGIRVVQQFTTAIDIDSGSIIPIPRGLDLPEDAIERLGAIFPTGARGGPPTDEAGETVLALLVPAHDTDASLQLARKGFALASLAGWTVNLERTGGAGLTALGRFVERTPCYASGWPDEAGVIALFTDLSRLAS